MQRTTLVRISAVQFALLLFLGTSVWAQKLADRPKQAAMRSLAYDATQETVMEGTVLSYSAEAATPPIGAHLLLPTAGGPVDLHLGGASYLAANPFSLGNGGAVRRVAVNFAPTQCGVFSSWCLQTGRYRPLPATSAG